MVHKGTDSASIAGARGIKYYPAVGLLAMSTRTQIRFVDESGEVVAQVYKHSDGYPDNIVPRLAELRETLSREGWVRGPHYAAAQFIFLDKLQGLRFCADKLATAASEHDPDTDRKYGLYNELQEHDGIGPARAETATAMADVLTDPEFWHGEGRMFFLGGHGVETGNIHGDEEYIYEVTVPNHRDDTSWHVKMSRDFQSPAWETRNGETRGYDYPEGTDAWSECTWEYSGDLTDAMAIVEAAREHDERTVEALVDAAESMADAVPQ